MIYHIVYLLMCVLIFIFHYLIVTMNVICYI
jgi:hypothetical protein